jgi:hypothetical protein
MIVAIMSAEFYIGMTVLESILKFGVSITLLGERIDINNGWICLLLELLEVAVALQMARSFCGIFQRAPKRPPFSIPVRQRMPDPEWAPEPEIESQRDSTQE